MKSIIKTFMFSLTLLAATTAWAQPKIDVVLKAETEVKKVVDGKEVLVRIPAKEVDNGQTIFYTLTCRNTGTNPATGVKVNDPIPTSTRYVNGSARGEGADITFSIDGGKTYKKPTLLSYKIKRSDGTFEERLASPEEYTHIQWEINSIPAGGSVSVSFQTIVK